jgi:hypothetical protein
MAEMRGRMTECVKLQDGGVKRKGNPAASVSGGVVTT